MDAEQTGLFDIDLAYSQILQEDQPLRNTEQLDPYPELSDKCKCGAEVATYDPYGVAWCAKCHPASEENVKKVRLSHSQSEVWQQCPKKWHFYKVVKAEKDPVEAFIFGTAIHAAFEYDGRLRMIGNQATEHDLFSVFTESMETELSTNDPHHLLTHKKQMMRAKAINIIKAYVEHVQSKFKPFVVEEAFDIPLDDNTSFSGRIDAQTDVSIVDWKTASRPWAPEIMHTKDQAAAYLMARPEAKKVTFIVFSANQEFAQVQKLQTERTPIQIAAYKQKMITVAQEIRDSKRSNIFDVKVSALCGYCEYIKHCDAGTFYLKAKGKVPQFDRREEQ